MVTYRGKTGIKNLRDKINLKGRMLVSESAEKIATHLVDESVVGEKYYRSPTLQDNIANDQGDFKNSWSVGLGKINKTTRPADTTGSGAIAEAIIDSKRYNFEDTVYVTNSKDHAINVEKGWEDNATYGWSAKDGYHIVRDNEYVAEAILNAVAIKVSKI